MTASLKTTYMNKLRCQYGGQGVGRRIFGCLEGFIQINRILKTMDLKTLENTDKFVILTFADFADCLFYMN